MNERICISKIKYIRSERDPTCVINGVGTPAVGTAGGSPDNRSTLDVLRRWRRRQNIPRASKTTAAMAPIAIPAIAPPVRLECPLLASLSEDCAVAETVTTPCEVEIVAALEAFRLPVELVDDTRNENRWIQQGTQNYNKDHSTHRCWKFHSYNG